MEDIANSLVKKLKIGHQYETCEQKYSALKTDEDRVKFTLRTLQEEKVPPSLPEPSQKSVTVSQDYREKGNEFFVTPWSAPRLNGTIDLYTKSIIFASPESRELALGYANRSTALFKAKLYQDCLQDISRALALPYPDDLKAKLYARRARCLMTLKRPTEDQKKEIKEALKMAAEYLVKMAADDQGRRIVEKMLKEPEKMVPVDGEYVKWRDEALMPKVSDENPEIKGVSSALKLEFNEDFGRHVVATRDINPGEVLGVMRPYAAVLAPGKWFTHCAYCMEQTWSSVPCEACCNVVYCNEDCKNKAYGEYHDIECLVIGHLIALEMSNLGLLSVRLVVRAIKEAGSIQALREKVKDIEARKDPKTMGFTQGLLDDRDYASIYTLVRNTEKRSFTDLLGRSLNSSYILLALATKSDLFEKKFESKFDELEKKADSSFVGGLIMRHQQIIPSNVHSLNEEGLLMDALKKGAALMPFYSMMSHSCNPGVTRIGYGMNMVIYADYVIKKGEQVCDIYGPHYGMLPRSSRQRKLQEQFFFSCNCIACTEDWPSLSRGIPSFRERYLPYQTQMRLTNVMRNYPKYYELAVQGNVTNATAMINDLNNMIKVLQQTVPLPCGELTDVIETKKRILALTGNRFQSVNLKN